MAKKLSTSRQKHYCANTPLMVPSWIVSVKALAVFALPKQAKFAAEYEKWPHLEPEGPGIAFTTSPS
jgi:hypothetical protein